MAIGRLLALVLLILGLATPADAAPQMYSGEMIVHLRGSDAAGDFVAIPFGAHCNIRPYHAAHTAMFVPPEISATYTLTIPKFGGQTPVIDTDTDSVPDVAAGCAPASLHAGLPLTGAGSLATTGKTSTSRNASNPRGFNLPASGLSRMTSGASFLPTTWLPLTNGNGLFNFEIEYADLKNAAGGFSKAGGPGSFTVMPSGSVARVHVKAGKNQFGGTMRLLGQYHTNRGIESATTSVAATPWNLQYIGAGAATATGVVTGGLKYTTMILRPYHYPGAFDYSPRTATISVFPWTTGTAEVTATGGPQTTALKRIGYDNRNPAGVGTVQMVSPALTRWKNAHSNYFTGSIATLKLRFVPEPESGLMLVAGIGTLALLYRVNHSAGAPDRS